nr:MAG TPA: tail protein [Caudoviricetes sp.]
MIYHMSGGGGTPVVPTASLTIDWDTGLVTSTATCKRGRVVSDTTRSSAVQLQTQGAATINPGTQRVTAVPTNRLVNGNVYVAGDSNLVSANIVSGKSIFGVPGSAFSLTTADAQTITLSDVAASSWTNSFFAGAKMLLLQRLSTSTYGGSGGRTLFVRQIMVQPQTWGGGYRTTVVGRLDTAVDGEMTCYEGNNIAYLNPSTGTIQQDSAFSYLLYYVPGTWAATKWY